MTKGGGARHPRIESLPREHLLRRELRAIAVARLWPPNAWPREVTEPERSNAVLRHPVVGRVEACEVGRAVTEPRQPTDHALHDRQVHLVIEAGNVADEVPARPQRCDQIARDLEHVALVLGAKPLSCARPRRARWVGDQEVDLDTPASSDHAEQVADIHANRSVAEVGFVGRAVILGEVERHFELDAGATEALGHAASAREQLEVDHGASSTAVSFRP